MVFLILKAQVFVIAFWRLLFHVFMIIWLRNQLVIYIWFDYLEKSEIFILFKKKLGESTSCSICTLFCPIGICCIRRNVREKRAIEVIYILNKNCWEILLQLFKNCIYIYIKTFKGLYYRRFVMYSL